MNLEKIDWKLKQNNHLFFLIIEHLIIQSFVKQSSDCERDIIFISNLKILFKYLKFIAIKILIVALF